MQKLASLGYVGLQKSAGASAIVTGTDPKDKIAIANKVMEAAEAVAQAKPDHAIAALEPITSADPTLYLAQYALGVALAQTGKYAEAAKHLHKAVELQPDSAWAHYAMGATLLKNEDYKTAARCTLKSPPPACQSSPSPTSPSADAYAQLGRAEDAKRTGKGAAIRAVNIHGHAKAPADCPAGAESSFDTFNCLLVESPASPPGWTGETNVAPLYEPSHGTR